jgi:hypothetical protein
MDDGGRDKLVVLRRITALLALGLVMAAAGRCGAATIRRAWIEHRGRIYTIHLEVGGRPRWVLGQQDNRLLIDLLNTNSNLSAREFLHAAIGPLGAVRISGNPQRRLRIEIDAGARCDFLVGRKRNQLLVSLAPAGAKDASGAAPGNRATPGDRAAADNRAAICGRGGANQPRIAAQRASAAATPAIS